MFTQDEILNRGWTPAMIRCYLGDPDITTHNGYCSNRPMKLWDRYRVMAVETSTEWREWNHRLMARRKRRKRQKM